MVYQTDLMEEERQLPTAGTRSKLPAFTAAFAASLLPQPCGLQVCLQTQQTGRQHPHTLVTAGTAGLCANCCHAGPHCPTLACQTFRANPRPYMLACTTASHAWPGTSSIFRPRPMANFGLCLFPEIRERSNWSSLQMPLPLLHLIKLLAAFTQSAQVV